MPDVGGPEEVALRDSLVVAKAFGEPMYPALVPADAIERAPGKPWHVLINADNYHALQLLLYGYEGKVDVIYIDPPYNTGARDWKYNNNYVDKNDQYRHSKWLSMMNRRLKLAKRLLRSDESVLIVTIDENEYLRLGLLLEDVFAGSIQQMVSITINPKGRHRPREFARVDEFAFFILLGSAGIPLVELGGGATEVRWPYLRRSDLGSVRGTRPRQFYPIFVEQESMKIFDIG
ncbi:MAG TPA: DNA methyltransferase, partial [Nitrospiraceae bacterium]|nr:DNA methyltransferase [Nitrospiraceae bacterium]